MQLGLHETGNCNIILHVYKSISITRASMIIWIGRYGLRQIAYLWVVLLQFKKKNRTIVETSFWLEYFILMPLPRQVLEAGNWRGWKKHTPDGKLQYYFICLLVDQWLDGIKYRYYAAFGANNWSLTWKQFILSRNNTNTIDNSNTLDLNGTILWQSFFSRGSNNIANSLGLV